MNGDVVVAFVEFADGTVDWLSLDGLAFYRDLGRVKRSMVVTLPCVPARPVMGLTGDCVPGRGVLSCGE